MEAPEAPAAKARGVGRDRAAGDRDAWRDLRQRARALTEEARCRAGSGQPPEPAWLRSAGAWLAGAAPGWQALTGDAPPERTWWAIARGTDLDAWLICWPPGVRLDFHDHGGSSGCMWVVDGQLDETWVDATTEPIRRRRVRAGRGVAFGPDYVHAVANRTSVLATTVHLYGPDSRPVRDYRVDGAGRLRRVSAGEPASLSW